MGEIETGPADERRPAAIRAGRTLILGTLGGAAVIAFTIWMTGSIQFFRDQALKSTLRVSSIGLGYMMKSRPVRWWRLRHISIPDLDKAVATRDYSGAALEYSWFGGNGPGDVFFHLDGNGDCKLTLAYRRPKGTKEYQTHLSPARVHEIFSGINSTGILRLIPEESNRLVMDLGRFDIVVTAGGVSRDLIFDGNRVLDNPEAFFRAREVILSLSQELGVDFAWSPAAYTVASSGD